MVERRGSPVERKNERVENHRHGAAMSYGEPEDYMTMLKVHKDVSG